MKKSKRKLAFKELEILKLLHALPTFNSGAINQDGDGEIKTGKIGFYQYDNILVEVKATEKKSFSITKDVVEKMITQARRYNKLPILAVDISGSQTITMRLSDFTDLLEWALRENLQMKDLFENG